MDNINFSNLCNNQSESSSPVLFPIEELPKDLICEVLGELNLRELQAVACTSKKFKELTAEVNQIFLIRKFVDFLAFKLEQMDKSRYINEVTRLHQLKDNHFISNFLKDAKKAILQLRRNSIEMLCKVKEGDLIKLNELSKDKNLPEYFDVFFNLIHVYQRLEKVKDIVENVPKDRELENILFCLVAFGDLEKAIEVIKQINLDESKTRNLCYIASLFIERDEERAFGLVKTDEEYAVFAENLAKLGEMKSAMRAIKLIKDVDLKNRTLEKSVKILELWKKISIKFNNA